MMPTVDTDRPVVNVDESVVLGLDREAAAQLLRTAHTDGVRSYALVALLLLRELRIAEALALDAEDVATTVRGHRVATTTGKGGRTRFAVLTPAVTRALDSGANVVDVQAMAGHRDPRTTSNNAWPSELHPGRRSAALPHRLFTVGARGAWHGFRMVTGRGSWQVGR